MRYKISEHINILPAGSLLKSAKNNENSFLIKNDLTGDEFLINETIKVFIEKFTISKSLNEVIAQIAAEINASIADVKKIVYPFFKYIRHRCFIIPQNHSAQQIKAHPFLNPDSVIDHYKIQKLISVNGDVEVYKAADLTNNNEVIIKLSKQPSTKNINELQREYSFLQSLQNAAVVPAAYKLIVKDEYAYFSQSFITGLSLPQFIHRTKQTDSKTIFTIIKNILQGFATIHADNIVHGDIHPSNVIVENNYSIKVIDFGLAINSELDKNELVNFGGAYFFMPPERIKVTTHKKFTRQPDFYSDVFQLGVVLYMLLYDVYPFNGITWEDLATEIKEKPIEFPALSKYNFLVPEWLNAIIATCVAKKPKQRFADAQQLYNAFKKSYDACKTRPAVEI